MPYSARWEFQPTSRKVNIYLLGCLHHGSNQSDFQFIRNYIKFISEDPDGYWIGLGDLVENNLPGSKGGTVFEQYLHPREQIYGRWMNENGTISRDPFVGNLIQEGMVQLLEPIKEKGLFLLSSNHSQRTRRAVGEDPDRLIAKELDLLYAGDAFYGKIVVHKTVWKIYAHHARGGARTQGGKVQAIQKLREIAPTADICVGAHVHAIGCIPSSWLELAHPARRNKKKRVLHKTGWTVLTGSALRYDQGYGETFGLPPAVKKLGYMTLRGIVGGRDAKQLGLEMFEFHVFSDPVNMSVDVCG